MRNGNLIVSSNKNESGLLLNVLFSADHCEPRRVFKERNASNNSTELQSRRVYRQIASARDSEHAETMQVLTVFLAIDSRTNTSVFNDFRGLSVHHISELVCVYR